MEEWRTVVISGIFSLISAGITAPLTAILTYHLAPKNDARKQIRESRTKFYLEAYPVIDTFINQPQMVYNFDYMEKFIACKATMKLLASDATFQAYANLFNLVIVPHNAYDIYDGKHQSKRKQRYYYYDPEDLAKIPEEDLKLPVEDFQKKYMPDKKEIDACVQALYEAMRNDLGSNLK